MIILIFLNEIAGGTSEQQPNQFPPHRGTKGYIELLNEGTTISK